MDTSPLPESGCCSPGKSGLQPRKYVAPVLLVLIITSLVLLFRPSSSTTEASSSAEAVSPSSLDEGRRSAGPSLDDPALPPSQRAPAAAPQPNGPQTSEPVVDVAPRSMQFLPFELPALLANSTEYVSSAAFNPDRKVLSDEALADLSELIARYNEQISRANDEALLVLEPAVSWKIELGDVLPEEEVATRSGSAEHAWIVRRTYADGTKRAVAILPGEYGPLDGACARAQGIYMEGEEAIVSTLRER